MTLANAQLRVWVHVRGGNALFYNPETMNWEPIIEKQQIPAKTFVFTQDIVQFKAFKETNVVDAPSNGYFFLDDIFPRNKMQLVEELTLIEAQQLRSTIKGDSSQQKNVIGLTYGLPSNLKIPDPSQSIPNFKERENAIYWFYDQQRYDAAVLSLKRLIIQFPSLYYNLKFTELLLKLYDKLELYGFLYSETSWLMTIQKDGELGTSIKHWNDFAKQKLTNR
jgi:hypothetical protein